MRTFQFRLRPTKRQLSLVKEQLEVHRNLYNHCLELKIKSYKDNKINLSSFDLMKSEIPSFKGMSNSSSLQQTIRRLDKAYKTFFKQQNKFPRFRAKNRFRTIEFAIHGDGCKIRGNKIYIQYIGEIKSIQHREIPNDYKIKTLSLSLNKNELYINIICSREYGKVGTSNKSIGIDFGIKHTITTSDEKHVESPTFTKDKLANVKRLSKRKKYKALNKIYSKIRNKRKDFNHKLSRKIVNDYDIICLENLKIQEITSFKHVNRRLYDLGINQLINFIVYKAESAGKQVIMVNPRNTTRECSNCGNLVDKNLSERIHKCSCGLVLDRDINAAKNILRLGLQSLGVNP